MHIIIKGCFAYDTTSEKVRFFDWFSSKDFEGGYVPKEYVLVADHTIDVNVPDVNLVTVQLDALRAQETEVTAKYQAAKTAIEARRQNLLAIEFEAQS